MALVNASSSWYSSAMDMTGIPEFVVPQGGSTGVYALAKVDNKPVTRTSMGSTIQFLYHSVKYGPSNGWWVYGTQLGEWAVFYLECPGCGESVIIPKEDYICEECRS